MWALQALTAGRGIRAVARLFEGDPHTVLAWLGEAAAPRQAFSHHMLHDVRVTQVPLDELSALRRAVTAGAGSEAAALQRLARSPRWVWVAMDPVSQVLRALDGGARTLAMAPRVVHPVAQGPAPGCVPLCLPDGFTAYATALVTPSDEWGHPARRPAAAPFLTPRGRPLPQRGYAQVIKTVRRRRRGRVTQRVVCGTLDAIQQVLAAQGGRARPPSSSASTSPSASLGPRWGGAS